MPRFIIERHIPDIGKASQADLAGAAQKSCAVLTEMGPHIQWVESYVADDKTYCVYLAPDRKAIEEHAARSGFPANEIVEVRTIIDPTTAEAG